MTTMNTELKATDPNAISMTRVARIVGLVVVFLWFAVGCIPHFIAVDTEMRIMPPSTPYPHALVLISGVFELLGAIGILIPKTRRAAGIGLLLLTIAVTPANVYMAQHADLFHLPLWALEARLVFQVFFLWLIWWTTWNPPPRGKWV
jgi:uncharacterized membrane protein